MPRTIRTLLLAALLLVAALPAADASRVVLGSGAQQTVSCGPTLTYGTTMLCTLTTAGELDSFTFAAVAGDQIIARLAMTSSSLQPLVRVRSPSSTIVCQRQGTGRIADTDACLLAASGTYTVEVSSAASGVGSYGLALQRLNAPADATPFTAGKSLLDALAAPGEIATYTLTADLGDTLVIRMASTTIGMQPYLRLYSSDGVKRCESSSASRIAETSGCIAPASGTYTLILTTVSTSDSGTYGVAFQRVNSPAGADSLAIGTPVSATLATPAELDSYTFSADAQQTVVLRMASTSSVDPQIRIYRPGGVLQCSNTSYSPITEVICLLPVMGSYTVLSSAFGEPTTGSYALSLQRISPPAGASPLVAGITATRTFTMAGQLATHTFSGQANEAVYLRMGVTQSSLNPQLRIFGDDGASVCGNYGYGAAIDVGPCLLPRDGSYTVLASALDEAITGPYALTFQRIGQPEQAQTLFFNRDQRSDLPSSASLGTHTFTAAGSSSVRLRITKKSGDLNPMVQILSVEGTRLCSAQSYGEYAEIVSCVLPTDAVYTILASSLDGSTGSYRLNLSCLTGTCGALIPPEEHAYLPLVVR